MRASCGSSILVAVGLRHLTIQEAVVDAVRARIISGELAAGTRIDQDALAEEFAVSRMPVREALRQLGAEGFVTIVPHRGVIVTQLSEADIEEIFEIRAALEALATRLALGSITVSALAELRSVLAQLDQQDVPEVWIELNDRFHTTIMEGCGRPRLLELIQHYRHLCWPYVRLYVEQPENSSQARAEHHAIVAAIDANDADALEHAVRDHLLNTGRGVSAWASARDGGAPTRR